jgi:hypothetical protein
MQPLLVRYIPQSQPKPTVPPQLAPHIATTNQSVLTSTEAYANGTLAHGDTNALQSDVKETTPTPTAQSSECPLENPNNSPQTVPQSPTNSIHVNMLAKELQQYPNQTFAAWIVTYRTSGMSHSRPLRYTPLCPQTPSNFAVTAQHLDFTSACPKQTPFVRVLCPATAVNYLITQPYLCHPHSPLWQWSSGDAVEAKPTILLELVPLQRHQQLGSHTASFKR